MPVAPPLPPLDMSGMGQPMVDPMQPAASPMDAMATGSAPMQDQASNTGMPMTTPPVSTSPATMDDLMAELRKIEDKLVEMDEKL